jgi:hypothetical protein
VAAKIFHLFEMVVFVLCKPSVVIVGNSRRRFLELTEELQPRKK